MPDRSAWIHPSALSILRRLRDAGFDAYLCGGCVRDHLLGKRPKDFDITTSATPDEIELLFEKTVPVGKAFGVMIVVTDDGHYEVATFRTESGYADGRRPDAVVFSNAREDVLRRDVTINALLYDPDSGEVLDYVGGQDDLKRGLLRTVGDPRQRFSEDKLRLLRAVRFAARTGFVVEPETFAAIRELAHTVVSVSGERIGEEVRRMLVEGYARRSFELLDETGLLAVVLPEVAALHGVAQPPEFHPEGDVWKHTLLMLDILDRDDGEWSPVTDTEREVLGFAALLHDIGKPATFSVSDRIRFHGHDALGASMSEEVLRRLKRPREVIDAVRDIIGRHMHFAHLPRMKEAKRRRFLQEAAFPLHLSLHRLDCLGSHENLSVYAYGLNAWQVERAKEPPPPRLLNGRDLMELGYKPGPELGRALSALEDAQLEGKVVTREEALAFIRDLPPAAPESAAEPDAEDGLQP